MSTRAWLNDGLILTKSIYDPVDDTDGIRVLVTRYYPRGVKKERVDRWMRNLSPSAELLRRYRANEIGWGEFSKKFMKELAKNSESQNAIREVLTMGERGTVTLLCYEREGQTCHRYLLKRLLDRRRIR